MFPLKNRANASFNRSTGPEETPSNETVTEREELPLGEITISKRILASDILWAHGNPTFFFAAEGNDILGDYHRYEECLSFSPDSLQEDSSGHAVLSVTIRNVPAGSYELIELPVNDYYLTEAKADTSNVQIVNTGAPGKNKKPKETAYGTCTISKKALKAGITFTDQKEAFNDYRHNDVAENVIPLKF